DGGTLHELLGIEGLQEDSVEGAQRRAHLRATAEKMLPRHLAIVELYTGELLTLQETGARLGIHTSHVCKLLGDIVERARRAAAGEPEEEVKAARRKVSAPAAVSGACCEGTIGTRRGVRRVRRGFGSRGGSALGRPRSPWRDPCQTEK